MFDSSFSDGTTTVTFIASRLGSQNVGCRSSLSALAETAMSRSIQRSQGLCEIQALDRATAPSIGSIGDEAVRPNSSESS